MNTPVDNQPYAKQERLNLFDVKIMGMPPANTMEGAYAILAQALEEAEVEARQHNRRFDASSQQNIFMSIREFKLWNIKSRGRVRFYCTRGGELVSIGSNGSIKIEEAKEALNSCPGRVFVSKNGEDGRSIDDLNLI